MSYSGGGVVVRADEVSALGGLYGRGWLALFLPAGVQRFRVDDPDLAHALADAGATIVESGAEVDIGTAPPRGDRAPFAIVEVAVDVRPGPLLLRALRRVGGSLAVRLRARRVRRALAERYPSVETRLWDVGHTMPFTDVSSLQRRRRPSEWLPQRALVIGRSGDPAPTLFDVALRDASEQAGRELAPRWASIRAGTVVVAVGDAVLRLAVGPARIQIAAQIGVLEELGRTAPPELVGRRVPWLLGHGRVSLVDWSLERLLPGSRPPRELSPELCAESVDFLVELRRIEGAAAGGRSIAELAGEIATVLEPGEAVLLDSLCRRLEPELAGLSRGFGHGDFFAGNLLADRGRVTAVLDWDAGGTGRLPLLDLLHLRRTLLHDGTDLWGHVLVTRLLPELRAGGDEMVRRYCGELGLEPDPALLERLLWAYWLEHAAYQLRTHAHRRGDDAWIEANVRTVLRVAAG